MPEIIETEIGLIPAHWKIVPFNKALKVKGRVGWKGYKTSDLRNGGPIVVGGTNIKANLYLDFSQTTYLSREKFEESPEIMLQKGDVILVTRGNGIGDVGYYDGQFPEATINPSLVILSQFIGSPKFLFYYLNSPQGRFQVLSIEGGTSIPALYQGYINTLLCPIPPKDEQEFIIDILSSIDEKIDLLNHQNHTIEKLVETLFRQWFMEEVVDTWDVSKLGNVFDIGIGRTPPRKEPHWFSTNSNNMKWVSIKDMGNSGAYLYSTAEYLTQDAVEAFNIPIIPENTVILSFKMTIGRTAITTEKMLSNEAIAHFKQKDKSNLFPEFIYLYLKSYKWEQLGSTSSIVEAINSQMIKDMQFVIPDEHRLRCFKDLIDPYFEKIKGNQTQINSLSKLRDTLLPKLMSGEVRVKMDNM